MVLLSGFARLGDDLLRGRNCFSCLLFLDACSGLARLLDKFGRLRIRLSNDLLPLDFGSIKLRFNLFGVRETLGDLLPALLQHG